jgi:hypothetical protein
MVDSRRSPDLSLFLRGIRGFCVHNLPKICAFHFNLLFDPKNPNSKFIFAPHHQSKIFWVSRGGRFSQPQLAALQELNTGGTVTYLAGSSDGLTHGTRNRLLRHNLHYSTANFCRPKTDATGTGYRYRGIPSV